MHGESNHAGMGSEESSMSLDPQAVERRLQELRNLADRAAKAKRVLVMMEEGKKSTLAVLMKRYAAKGFDSAAAQEREARADPEMNDMINAWGDAAEEYESARLHLEVAKMGIQVWQTIESSRRAEMKGYGL